MPVNLQKLIGFEFRWLALFASGALNAIGPGQSGVHPAGRDPETGISCCPSRVLPLNGEAESSQG
jgi:hypothetical protein